MQPPKVARGSDALAAAVSHGEGEKPKPQPGGVSLKPGSDDFDVDAPRTEPQQLQVAPITVLKSEYREQVVHQIVSNTSYICYGLKQGHIRVLNKDTATRALLKGHTCMITDMRFYAATSNLLASCDQSGKVFVRKIFEGSPEAGIQEEVLASHSFDVGDLATRHLAWHPHMENMLAVLTRDRIAFVNVPPTSGLASSADFAQPILPEQPTLTSGQSNFTALAFSHQGDLLAASTSDGTVEVWAMPPDLASKQQFEPLPQTPHHSIMAFWGEFYGKAAACSMDFLPSRAPRSVLVVANPTANWLELWVVSHPEGSPMSAERTYTLQLHSSAQGPSAFFNHLLVQPNFSIVVLANTKRKQVYVLHAHQDAHSSHAVFDHLCLFEVRLPILSMSTLTEPGYEHGSPVQEFHLYCVQTEAIQQYTLHPSACFPPADLEEDEQRQKEIATETRPETTSPGARPEAIPTVPPTIHTSFPPPTPEAPAHAAETAVAEPAAATALQPQPQDPTPPTVMSIAERLESTAQQEEVQAQMALQHQQHATQGQAAQAAQHAQQQQQQQQQQQFEPQQPAAVEGEQAAGAQTPPQAAEPAVAAPADAAAMPPAVVPAAAAAVRPVAEAAAAAQAPAEPVPTPTPRLHGRTTEEMLADMLAKRRAMEVEAVAAEAAAAAAAAAAATSAAASNEQGVSATATTTTTAPTTSTERAVRAAKSPTPPSGFKYPSSAAKRPRLEDSEEDTAASYPHALDRWPPHQINIDGADDSSSSCSSSSAAPSAQPQQPQLQQQHTQGRDGLGVDGAGGVSSSTTTTTTNTASTTPAPPMPKALLSRKAQGETKRIGDAVPEEQPSIPAPAPAPAAAHAAASPPAAAAHAAATSAAASGGKTEHAPKQQAPEAAAASVMANGPAASVPAAAERSKVYKAADVERLLAAQQHMLTQVISGQMELAIKQSVTIHAYVIFGQMESAIKQSVTIHASPATKATAMLEQAHSQMGGLISSLRSEAGSLRTETASMRTEGAAAGRSATAAAAAAAKAAAAATAASKAVAQSAAISAPAPAAGPLALQAPPDPKVTIDGAEYSKSRFSLIRPVLFCRTRVL
ncbi:hypothetical protein DUNSADRAFT_14591 [Dunaliella salina]|uniref:Enhancer of mRNA-decapping protein 4 WD40 repeat region domain-containing protein n=1 Tax=Dunaliella salina TaxID=3046 RepID=A0ABQ7H2K2_DUNSA|nr:hypothetical protein DUNSADRAFT_14591 [Dunaliella salina]|eukprot:KAF5841033.1 hypothetical protein DUNSADRAFT_14591 [Dunaliella salina]